jgi:hypothetical protein
MCVRGSFALLTLCTCRRSRVEGVWIYCCLLALFHRCIFAYVACCFQLYMALAVCNSQLSAMDVSVRSTMKGAAKCDKHCELQNSVNRQGLERILCFWDIPESMPASVSMLYCSSGFYRCCCDCLRLRMCSFALLRHQMFKARLRR